MRRAILSLLFLGGAALLATPAVAQKKFDFGKREYQSNCAVCHGAQGHGDGPYAGLGTQKIADLTRLAANNGGVFPFQRVYETIDGSAKIFAHGTYEMPIWGTHYRQQSSEALFDVPYDSEAYARTRIVALTEYINRIQAR